MVVQHNLMAMNANRMLGLTTKTVSGSTEKLSSGYRINRAADDAAGLAISEKMRKQVRGLTQAAANAEDGISCVQTAEGALAEVQDMLQRMNELCVQAANGTNSISDRQYIQDEIDQLVSEIDRIAETTKFNETFLLKGDPEGSTTSVYITNYTVTYVRNEMTPVGNTTPTTYSMKYVGSNNIYMVDKKIKDMGPTIAVGSDTISTGEDITKYLQYDAANGTTNNQGAAKLNDEQYVAFVNVELDSELNAGKDLKTDGTTSIVRANKELYVYNTANGNVTHLTEGTEMTTYLDDQNRMLDEYRLIDILDAAGGSSVKVKETVLANQDFKWTDQQIRIIEGTRQLYNAEGTLVSGIALNNYFDKNGNYTGGLFTTSQARAADEVFASVDNQGYQDILASNGSPTTIGRYISQSTKQVTDALTFNLHVGAQSDRKNKITAAIETLTSAGIGIDKLASYNIGIVDETGDNATDAVDVVGDALTMVSKQRSALGAVQNRLEHTTRNLDNIVENTTAAESSIRDTNMAEEMVRYANSNILMQAGQAMLAQANQSNQGVLSLLQ